MQTLPLGELAALSCAILWSTTSILFTSAGRLAPPVATNFFKSSAAALLFGVVLLLRDGTPFPQGVAAGDFWLLAWSGVAGLTLADSCLYQGFQVVGTRTSNLLMSMAPVLGAVGGWVFLDEVLSPQAALGMSLAVVGVVLVLSDQGTALPVRGRRLVVGLALGFGAAGGQAVGALLAKPVLARVATLEATTLRVAAGAVGLLVYGILRRDLWMWTQRLSSRAVLTRLGVASVLGPFVGIFLMTYALDRAPTAVALTLIGSTPIWLLPLGAWLQKDAPTGREILGAVVAVVGIALLLLR